jgi:hypothetical protein
MPKNQIRSTLCAVALSCAGALSHAQVPASSAVSAAADSEGKTLRDQARIEQEIEFEKRKKALRDLKAATVVAPGTPGAPTAPQPLRAKHVKSAPIPDQPLGLQLRAVFGVSPNVVARFLTSTGDFEDHPVGSVVQGWKVTHIENGTVFLQRGATQYPMKVQMQRFVESDQQSNVVQSGTLPDPRIAGSAR